MTVLASSTCVAGDATNFTAAAGHNKGTFDNTYHAGFADGHCMAYDNTYGSWPNDQYSQVKVTTLGTVAGEGAGPACRHTSGQYYYIRCTSTNTHLYKYVSGGRTQLDVTGSAVAVNSVIKLECIGTSIKGYDDGVEILSATDSALTGGEAGMYGYGGVSTNGVLDDWEGGDTSTDYSATGSTGIQNWQGFAPTQLGVERTITPGTAYFNWEGFAASQVAPGLLFEGQTGVINFQGFSPESIQDAIALQGLATAQGFSPTTHVTRTFFGLLGELRAIGYQGAATDQQTYQNIVGQLHAQGFAGTVSLTAPPSSVTANALLGEVHFRAIDQSIPKLTFPNLGLAFAEGLGPQYIELIKELTGPDPGFVNVEGIAAAEVVIGQIKSAIAQYGDTSFVGFQHAVAMQKRLDSLLGQINVSGYEATTTLIKGGELVLNGGVGNLTFEGLSQSVQVYRTFYPETGITTAVGFDGITLPAGFVLARPEVGIVNFRGFNASAASDKYFALVGVVRATGTAATVTRGRWRPIRRKATKWAAIS